MKYIYGYRLFTQKNIHRHIYIYYVYTALYAYRLIILNTHIREYRVGLRLVSPSELVVICRTK